jgi:hypothetical protein
MRAAAVTAHQCETSRSLRGGAPALVVRAGSAHLPCGRSATGSMKHMRTASAALPRATTDRSAKTYSLRIFLAHDGTRTPLRRYTSTGLRRNVPRAAARVIDGSSGRRPCPAVLLPHAERLARFNRETPLGGQHGARRFRVLATRSSCRAPGDERGAANRSQTPAMPSGRYPWSVPAALLEAS